jgi:6-phosphogluconolactonase
MNATKFFKMRKIALALLLLSGATAVYAGQSDLYAMSNAKGGNQIAVLKRADDGSLQVSGRYATGGEGTGIGLVNPVDPLGSQNALLLSKNHKWLYAVNAGSNQLSVLRVLDNRLELADVLPSGGRFPVSVAERNGVLYVLNAGNEGNVTGFRIEHDGKLKAIPGSTRSLHDTPHDVGAYPDILRTPAQIQFSPSGEWLVLTVKHFDAPGTIQRFAVNDDGLLSQAPLVSASPDTVPFGFTFDLRGHLLVTEAISATLSSYRLDDAGALSTIGRTAPNGQLATCWIDATRKFVYVSNTNSDTLSGYRLDRSGKLVNLNPNGVVATLTAGHGPVDVKASSDGRYLNVVNSGAGTISSYLINEVDGQLKAVSETIVFPPLSGMEGLASE